jgi:hypothetical protein
MQIGNDWTVLNLGVRFRQKRSGAWINPRTAFHRFAFGLCHGTEAPYGSTQPEHFVGVRSSLPLVRDSNNNFWRSGWELITVARSDEYVHLESDQTTTGRLRVSLEDDNLSSAWYLRFTRNSETSITLDLFTPTKSAIVSSPTEEDFLTQLDREKWNQSVNNHGSYAEFSSGIHFDPSLGGLDSVNIFSDLPNFTSNQLRAVEWLSVNAVRID